MGRDEARRFNEKALEMIDAGNKVLTAYERLATGPFGGYVTVFAGGTPESLLSKEQIPRYNDEDGHHGCYTAYTEHRPLGCRRSSILLDLV